MPGRLEIVSAHDRYERSACAYAAVQEMLRQGRHVAWIVPSRDIALAVKRHLADAGKGLAGVEVATLDTWAAGRWTLYGDGRAPIGNLQRRLLVKKTLEQGDWSSSSLRSTGMVSSLASIVRAGAGLDAFEDACAQGMPAPADTQLTPAQLELLQAAKAYFALAQSHGLIEPGSAMRKLAACTPEAGWPHLVIDGCWNLEGAALTLVGEACTHAGVTLVGCLEGNAAFEAERHVAKQIEGLATEAGVEVTCRAGADLLTAAGVSLDSVRSPELIQLTNTLFSKGNPTRVIATGALRACLPAGRYAEGELLARQIGQLVHVDGIAARDIVVVAHDPLETARALGGPLSEHAPRGIALAVSGAEKLALSHASAFVLAWMRLLEAEKTRTDEPAPDLRAQVSDLARNPYMRVSLTDALKLDRDWRGLRMTSAHDFAQALRAQLAMQEQDNQEETGAADPDGTASAAATPTDPHGAAADTEGMATPKDLDSVLALLNARLPQPLSPQDQFERACAKALVRGADAWRELMGAVPSADDLAWLLECTSVPMGWVNVPTSDIGAQKQARVLQANPNAVRVVRPGEADALEARAVILCDLTADVYPLRERVDAKTSLWQALGIAAGPGQIAQLRRTFRSCIEAARDVMVVERVLADEEAKPLRPCALLEELVDCYRDDPSDIDGLDRTTGLPVSGDINAMGMGEETFAQLASPVTYAPALVRCDHAAFELADPELGASLANPDTLWSPSGLEALINCPMRWLHERKLPSDGLDVPFGDPRSRGTFCHLVLERFHDLLGQRTGIARITADTPREVWADVFDESFQYACDAQPQAERPLIPITELEKARLRDYRYRLVRCLEREQFMPEGFVPTYNEWKFGGESGTVTFGGVRISGIIDRIDLNPQTDSVLVVDYKGSLHKGHKPVQPKKKDDPSTLDPLPQHSQIIMYMAAVQQLMPERNLAGGLYVSYKKPECAGFLNMAHAGLVPEERGFYLQRKYCVPFEGIDGTPGVELVMARVEQAAAEAIAGLREGRVVAHPRFEKDSCSYCPLAGSCPREAK